MKKLLFIIALILLLNQNYTLANDEVELTFDNNFKKLTLNTSKYKGDKEENSLVLEKEHTQYQELQPIKPMEESNALTLQSEIYKIIKKTTSDITNFKTPINYNAVSPLLSEQLTKHFESGPLESLHTWVAVQNNVNIMMPEDGGNSTAYNFNLLNIHFDGKTRSGQDAFRLMFSTPPQQTKPFMQQLISDAYFETKRIPHHTILIGNSRVGTGYEGTQSSYTVPFALRAQIARNHSNIRKRGLRIRGNYRYVDYDTGLYSSDTYFSELFSGVEYNGWINFKPLQFTKKYGELTIGNGISTGKRSATDYFVYGAGIQYNYKKFWTRAEYSFADGSNGASGLTSKRTQGWYVTLAYHITQKAELLVRYDEFDPDKTIGHNNRREYTAGINYYVKGPALLFNINYIYCQNQAAKDSHRIIIGAQLAL